MQLGCPFWPPASVTLCLEVAYQVPSHLFGALETFSRLVPLFTVFVFTALNSNHLPAAL